jgi:melatonin receptor type 1B
MKCLWDRLMSWYYIIFVVMVGIVLPLITTVCFYVLLFLHINAAKKRAVSRGTNGNTFSLRSSIKQTKMMFVIFLCFIACWLPYLILLIADRYDEFAVWAHLYGSLMAHLHASINFIIYGICNRKIRANYKRLFYKSVTYCRDSNSARIKSSVNSVVGSDWFVHIQDGPLCPGDNTNKE